jgi:predicted Rossmann-fold nucleotide-binding protein
LVDPKVKELVVFADSVDEGLPELIGLSKKFPPPLSNEDAYKKRSEQAVNDVLESIPKLARLPTAVSYLGGHLLSPSCYELKVLKDLAGKLASNDVPARVGGTGPVMDAVSAGCSYAGRSSPARHLQVLLFDRGDGSFDGKKIDKKVHVSTVVHSSPIHKLLLHENTEAIVMVPGGPGTFDELWEIMTLLKLKKIPDRPVLLIEDPKHPAWTPMLETIFKQMDSDERKTVKPEWRKLFTVIHSAREGEQAVLAHREARENAAAAQTQPELT